VPLIANLVAERLSNFVGCKSADGKMPQVGSRWSRWIAAVVLVAAAVIPWPADLGARCGSGTYCREGYALHWLPITVAVILIVVAVVLVKVRPHRRLLGLAALAVASWVAAAGGLTLSHLPQHSAGNRSISIAV
jgi:hypothetical protein